MEQKKYSDVDCPIYGTNYCKKLNMPSCEKCTVRGRESVESLIKDLDALAELIPDDDMSRFFSSGDCMLCRGEKNPAACYAVTDIGNPKPKRVGRNFIGIKSTMRAGSLIPIQLSCCKECKKKLNAISTMSTLITIAVAACTLALVNITAIHEWLASIVMWLPLAVFAAATAGAALISGACRRKAIERYSKTTYMNLFDIPETRELKELGWFEMNPYKDVSHYVFCAEPLKQGVYTAKES